MCSSDLEDLGYTNILELKEWDKINLNNDFKEDRTPLVNNLVMLLSFISVIGFTVLAKKDN